MALIFDHLRSKVSVRNVSFETVPLDGLTDFVLVDDNFHVLAYLKELVVAPFVYLILSQRADAICLVQPFNAALFYTAPWYSVVP